MIQMTYTGLENRRWDIERTLGSDNPAAADVFAKICGQCNPNQLLYAFDHIDGVYVLLQSSPRDADFSGRVCCYVHGYIFSEQEAKELLSDYRKLLGIDYFATDSACELIPNDDAVSKSFDEKYICKNTALLVECIYEAVFSDKKLEILSADKDSVAFTKKLIRFVYEYLPPVLRKFVTFSNCADNIVRRLTVTDKFTGNAELRFDDALGTAQGLTGKYSIFVNRLFTPDKDSLLGRLDSEVCSYSEDTLLKEIYYTQIIRSILPSEDARSFMSDEDYLNLFYSFAFGNEKKYRRDYVLLNIFLEKFIQEGRILADTVDKKLLEFYADTDVSKLKDNIAAYLLSKYTSDAQKNDFDGLNKFKENNSELFGLILEKAISSNSTAFISWLASSLVGDAVQGIQSKKLYSQQAIKAACEVLAQEVIKSNNPKEDILKIIRSCVHSEVLEILLKSDMGNETVWNYISAVFGSQEAYESYLRLDDGLKMTVELFFCVEMSCHPDDAQRILGSMYRLFDSEQIRGIERLAVVNGNAEILKTFYENVLANSAKSTRELEERKLRLKELQLDCSGFNLRAANNYTILSFRELERSSRKPVEFVKRIKAFCEDACDVDNYRLKTIISQYWKAFSWKNFDFESEEISVMYHKDIAESVLAGAIVQVADYITGKTDSISQDALEVCRTKLKSRNKTISRGCARKILLMLKDLADNSANLPAEVYELMSQKKGKKKKPEFFLNIPELCALILIVGAISAFCVLNTHLWKKDIDFILGASCAVIALFCSQRTLCLRDREYSLNVLLTTAVLVVAGFLFQILTKLLK